MAFDSQVELLMVQINAAPGMKRLQAVRGLPDFDAEVVGFMLSEALRFASEKLAPFDTVADREGCRLEAGRVVLATGHRELWHDYRAAGWAGLDIAPEYGGQGLPRILATAVQECFDRASVTFGMVPGAARAASRLLQQHADTVLAKTWISKLATGDWGATICISESGAGSDVGRIRTSARRTTAGSWLVSGEKMWISYADHDLTERIGHIVLARPQGAAQGIRGLSLFLVPSILDRQDGIAARNRVAVRRIEEKLGLHGSPTCVLGFEDAEGYMIGLEGRGVAQLFSMIVAMRLQVGTQGLGFAESSYRAAFSYAQQRRQGGPSSAPPLPIAAHADVQLSLMGMASRIATLRGLVYAGAIAGDLADGETDPEARKRAAILQAWLLPIIKNSGAETGFHVAADSILLFGGAGYTTEWPVERYLRDSRVLAIYEGTAGMQALDLVRRRWREPGTGFEAFVDAVNTDSMAMSTPLFAPLQGALLALEEAAGWLRSPERHDWEIEAAARPALVLATEVAHGWIGARLAALVETDSASVRMAACGRHALSVLLERAAAALVAVLEAPLRKKNCAALEFESES